MFRFDPREEILNSGNFKPGLVALGTVLFNGAVLAVAYALFKVAPRSDWPILAELAGFYAVSGGLILLVWRTLFRDLLRTRILRPGSWLGYLDLSMAMTALLVAPLIVCLAINALFRFF